VAAENAAKKFPLIYRRRSHALPACQFEGALMRAKVDKNREAFDQFREAVFSTIFY